MDRAALLELYDYLEWAWDQLAGPISAAGDEALVGDAPGSGWPALRDCFEHFLSSYDDWTAELTGTPMVAPDGIKFRTWQEVVDYRAAARTAFRAYLDGIDDEELNRIRPMDVDGEAIDYTPGEVLTNVLLHERGHHGDLTTLMYQLGIEIPWIDHRFYVMAKRGYI